MADIVEKKIIQIGVANISFAENGQLQEASFKPLMKGNYKELAKQLASTPADSEEAIKEFANYILAAFFTSVSNIELADMEKYQIRNNIDSCEKYANGRVKKAKILFNLEEL